MTQTKKPEVEFDTSRQDWDKAEYAGNSGAVANSDFSSGFSVGKPFWHELGVTLDEHPKTTAEALKIGGADWNIIQATPLIPAVTLPDGTEVLGVEDKQHKYLMRDDTGAKLGLVGSGYVPFTNTDAFCVADELLMGEQLLAETLVVLGGGKRVALLCRLPESIMIGDDPDETVDPFLALFNSFDGSQAFTVLTTDVRVSCKNTSRMAINGAQNIWRGRHTTGLPFRVDEMKDVLQLSLDYYSLFKETGDKMLKEKMGPVAGNIFLEQLVPLPVSTGKNDRAVATKKQLRALIQQIHDGTAPKIGDFDPATGENIKGTAWGWYNAVTACANHYQVPRGWNSEEPKKIQKAKESRFYRAVGQTDLVRRADALLVA